MQGACTSSSHPVHTTTLSSGHQPPLERRLRPQACFLACHVPVRDVSKSLLFSGPQSPALEVGDSNSCLTEWGFSIEWSAWHLARGGGPLRTAVALTGWGWGP